MIPWARLLFLSASAGMLPALAQDEASLPGIEPLPPVAAAATSPGWKGPMTFVQQSHGTCWAATALMLIRAYGGEASLFDLVGAMNGWVQANDDGGGAYGLPNTVEAYGRLVEVMNAVTPGRPFKLQPSPYDRALENVVSPVFDETRMSTVLKQWEPASQQGLPFIHASARHAWLMLRPDPAAPVPTWVVHDPKGGASADAREPGRGEVKSEGGPYWVVAQDWLQMVMRAKNDGFAYIAQVVQPKWPPSSWMPLQSLAVPFVAANGDRTLGGICFSLRANLKRCMAWKPFDPATNTPYGWQSCSPQKCAGQLSMQIEPWLDELQIALPVWNADFSPQVVGIRATATYGGGAPPPVASLKVQDIQTIPKGGSLDWSAQLRDVCALRQENRNVDGMLDIELWNAGRRIDRLQVRMNLAPRPRIDRISPPNPAPGDRVTIHGSGFGPTDATHVVELDGSALGVERWSEKSIEIRLPPSGANGVLRVAPYGSACAATLALSAATVQIDCERLQRENPNLCLFEGSDEFHACCGVDRRLPPGTTKDE